MGSWLGLVAVWTVSALMMFPRCGHLQVLTVEPNWAAFFTGELVNFTCDMKEGKYSDWYYQWLKDHREYYQYNTAWILSSQHLTTGQYSCRGSHKQSGQIRESVPVSLTISDRNLVLQHPAVILYRGETVSLRCRHRFQMDMSLAAFYRNGALIVTEPNQRKLMMSENAVEIRLQLRSDSSYTCQLSSEESPPIRLKVEPSRPKAQLRIGQAPAGGNMTLTCSVLSPSTGWSFFWYRDKQRDDSLTAQDVNFLSSDTISTSQRGVYWCRGGRGEPIYYTEYSSPIAANRAVVLLQPPWPQVYLGEALTLRCEIQGGEGFEWEYQWHVPSPYLNDMKSQDQYRISHVTGTHAGEYACLGMIKNYTSATMWSATVRLAAYNTKLQPVLTGAPSWIDPGDSVTLTCSVQDPYEGWRFYWYKAIPNLTSNFYDTEPLPGSSNGTQQFIVHGQTHTAGYVCEAGRGNPLRFTLRSKIKFVWSGEVQPAASLSVSPDQTQHFITHAGSLSLSCAGDSAAWTVRRFSSASSLTNCATWGSMRGPTCNVNMAEFRGGVYWCESATGQFSNAVNITGSYDLDAIVVFPAHPVTHGQPVTLRCKMRTNLQPSVIYFYKDGKIIQNDTRGEFVIPAASKSDQGFYKCGRKSSRQRGPSQTSPESWMSVAAAASPTLMTTPFPIWLTVGLVCGFTLAALLLLFLARYTKSKAMCTARSPNTHQSSAADPKIHSGEARTETPPLNDESTEVTYCMVVLKNAAEGGTTQKPEESAIYSNVGLHTTAGKLQPANEDKIVYAEVRKKV